MTFIPLFCHSHYSPTGVASCADLARRARALGYSAIGLSDEGTLAGYHEFDEACRAQGVRPLFGCRLRLDGFVLNNRSYPLDILIETEQGYRNLVRILTQYHDLKDKDTGLPKKLSLKGRTGGLWVILPPDGEMVELLRRQDREQVQRYLRTASEYFHPGLAAGADACFAEHSDMLFDMNQMLRDLTRFVKIPCIAAPRFYYADPSDAPVFEYLNHPQAPPDRGWTPPEDERSMPCLFAEAQIASRYVDGDDFLDESGELARRCAWRPGLHRRIIPVQDFERGFDANSFLFDLIIRGAAERYGEIGEEVKQQINREFEEVKTRGLAPFLLLHREIALHLDEQGISRGAGRGAAVASTLCYCLGITQLDPFRYRLAPQALAAEGETFPSIRIEIPSSAAPKVVQWLKNQYGENHVVQVGRRQEIRREVLIQELARWSGMNEEENLQLQREKVKRRAPHPVQQLREEAESRHWKRWRNPAFLGEIALRLAPRPGPLVSHSGLWTLSAEPVEYVIPTARTPDGERLTDIGEAAIDRLGGPRIEFVSHHLLNLLDRARSGASDFKENAAIGSIPLDDRSTFELLARGDTLGIPPLEGVTVKSMLRKHRPANTLQLLKVKTDANRGRSNEKLKDLTEELPDVLLSVQLAYFKARYPAAYYAGAISSTVEIGEDVSSLIRAIRRAGIEVLPPDINLSGPISTVFGGNIRLGLLTVKRVDGKVLDEILSVRLGGRFNSLQEFCGGISPRIVNLRVVQNLIAAGSFDTLGQSRAQLTNLASHIYKKHRAAEMRDGQDTKAQETLFDMTSMDGDSTSPDGVGIEPVAAWDFVTRARREREALGFNLMMDPLSRFPRTFEALKPMDPGQITPRQNGRSVRVAGLIEHIDDEGPLLGEHGERLLDLEGTAVWLNPTLMRVCSHALNRGEPVLVIGGVNLREGYVRIDADGLWRLQDLEDQAAKVANIRLNVDGENRATLRHLLALARLYPGSSSLELLDYGRYKGFTYRILARQKVFFCSPFYQGVCKILSQRQIELQDQSGQTLEIATSRGNDWGVSDG